MPDTTTADPDEAPATTAEKVSTQLLKLTGLVTDNGVGPPSTSIAWAEDRLACIQDLVTRPTQAQLISGRRAAIANLAQEVSVTCEIRCYPSVPVSRYMRISDIVYQSYYPADRTAQDLPVLILQAGGILEARAMKEFDACWDAACDVD